MDTRRHEETQGLFLLLLVFQMEGFNLIAKDHMPEHAIELSAGGR